MSKSLTASDLAQFTGSKVWYRHSMVRSVSYTEGVRYVASTGGAYWLIDEIAFAQVRLNLTSENFQRWMLVVDNDARGLLSCDDGNGRMLFKKRLSFTDFPLEEFTLYCCGKVILLPSEY